MIKQDYIIRMIQEIISSIAEVLIKRKRLNLDKKEEYNEIAKQILGQDLAELSYIDTDNLIKEYSNIDDGINKLELIAVSMLLMSDETENDLLLKTRLKQNGIDLLKFVSHNSKDYSLQREALINIMKVE